MDEFPEAIPAWRSAATQEAADFRRDGFLKVNFGFDPSLLDRIAQEARLAIGDKRRVQDLWRRSPAVRALAADGGVLDFLSRLYGRRAFPFQTLNFVEGSEQKAHSDTIHFSSDPQHFMCGVWVALEDVDEGNGPLFYYPGSHMLPVYTLADVGGADYAADYEPFAQKKLEESGVQRAVAVMKKGEAFIWEANLFHGGAQIRDKGRTRLSQVSHYFFEGCCYHTPLNEANGERFLREIYDVGRGRFVKQVREGKRIRPRLAVAVNARLDHFARSTPTS